MSDDAIAQPETIPQHIVTCRVCGEAKPRSDYYARQVRIAGDVGECKDCTRARVRRRAMTDPKVQEYDRKRAKAPHRRAAAKRVSERWNAQNKDAYRAHYLVGNAVRDGRLKKSPCLFCSALYVHAHHRDYSKPLEVIWLCPKCHHRLHANFPETEGLNKMAAE